MAQKHYNSIDEVPYEDVLEIIAECEAFAFMSDEEQERRNARKAARRAKKEAQLQADFEECVKFVKRVKFI